MSNENNLITQSLPFNQETVEIYFQQQLHLQINLKIFELITETDKLSFKNITSNYRIDKLTTSLPQNAGPITTTKRLIWHADFSEKTCKQLHEILNIVNHLIFFVAVEKFDANELLTELEGNIKQQLEELANVISFLIGFFQLFIEPEDIRDFLEHIQRFPSQIKMVINNLIEHFGGHYQLIKDQNDNTTTMLEHPFGSLEILPEETIVHILNQLDGIYLNQARLINRRWKNIIDYDKISNKETLEIENVNTLKNVQQDIIDSIANNDFGSIRQCLKYLKKHSLPNNLIMDVIDVALKNYAEGHLQPIILKLLVTSLPLRSINNRLVNALKSAMKNLDVDMVHFFIHYSAVISSCHEYILSQNILSIPSWDTVYQDPKKLTSASDIVLLFLQTLSQHTIYIQDNEKFYSLYYSYAFNLKNNQILNFFIIAIIKNNLENSFASECFSNNHHEEFLKFLIISGTHKEKDQLKKVYIEILSSAIMDAPITIIRSFVAHIVSKFSLDDIFNSSILRLVFIYLRLDILLLLFEYKLKPNALEREHLLPLLNHYQGKEVPEKTKAILSGFFTLLLIKGFSIHDKNPFSYQLMAATLAVHDDPDLIKVLLRHYQADNFEFVLHLLSGISKSNHSDLIKKCLSDIQPHLEKAVLFACEQKNDSMLKLILQQRLHWQVDFLISLMPITHRECLRLLMAEAEKMEEWTKDKKLILTRVIFDLVNHSTFQDSPENLQTLKYLIDQGTNVTHKGFPDLAITCTIKRNSPRTTRFLLNYYTNFNFLNQVYLLVYPRLENPDNPKDLDSQRHREIYQKHTSWNYVKLAIYIQALITMLDHLPDKYKIAFFIETACPGYDAKIQFKKELKKILDVLKNDHKIFFNELFQQVVNAMSTYLQSIRQRNDSIYLEKLGDFIDLHLIQYMKEIPHSFLKTDIEKCIEKICEEIYNKAQNNSNNNTADAFNINQR